MIDTGRGKMLQLMNCDSEDLPILSRRISLHTYNTPRVLYLVRLRGGMGKVLSMADRFYKKRKAEETKAKKLKNQMEEEEEELAPEYRGLPLEKRLELALDSKEDQETNEEKHKQKKVGKTRSSKKEKKAEDQDAADDSTEEELAGGDAGDQQEEEGDEQALEWITGAQQVISPSSNRTRAKDDEMDVGFDDVAAGKHRLRTLPCTGDAWAGLFFDVQAKDHPVLIKALCIASALYRREAHVCVQVFQCNGTSAGKEGDASLWDLIFSGCNCTLPTVAKNEAHPPGTEPYGQLPFDTAVRIAPGDTVGFGLYTNSLCGLALRWTSESLSRAEDVTHDSMGVRIGNTPAVPIVASAEAMRRNSMRAVQAGEVTDSDEYIRVRAGPCSAVTGQDHPFDEALLDRHPRNVRAFVGEIVYDVPDVDGA